jgi:hypothetical protein
MLLGLRRLLGLSAPRPKDTVRTAPPSPLSELDDAKLQAWLERLGCCRLCGEKAIRRGSCGECAELETARPFKAARVVTGPLKKLAARPSNETCDTPPS